MLKRFISCVIAMVMLISIVNISVPQNVAYAAGTIWLEVTKNDALVRAEKHDKGKVLRKLKLGTIITAEKKELNYKFRWWYKLKNGEYIYSGNVKETHEHKIVIVGYETAHPHYALHECRGCKNGGYCGPETKKVKGCEKCYPSSTESKKNDTNKIPNSNATTKADVLVPKQPSLQEEAEKNLGTPKHEHNYKFSEYASSHPHYAIYKCSCGDSYQNKNKSEKKSGCTTCYPPHQHSYKHIGYNNSHPHAAKYECSCGNGYSDSSKTTKIDNCSQCWPYGYGNDHFCQFVCTERFLNEHPHYTIGECTVCGKEDIDYADTNYSSKCDICTSSFKDKVENVPDFYGRVYDLSTGGIIYTPKKVTVDELYEFADELHLSLDALGLVPVVGEAFDGINVLYYIVEGNFVDAALSGASMVPFVGVVSTTGKIAKASGKIVIDATAETIEVASKKVAREILEENLKKNVSEAGRSIVKYSEYYSEATLKTIKNISENATITLENAFYNGKILFTEKYLGTVKSASGLRYGYLKSESRNCLHHIIDRHSYRRIGKSTAKNFFNVSDEQIFYVIEDVYRKGQLIDDPIKRLSYDAYYYKAPYVIGSDGEDILCLVLEKDRVISAYPVYGIPKGGTK